MTPATGAWGRAALVTGAVLVADQLSKAVVRASIERGEEIDLVLGIDLVNARNSGVAFGALAGGGVIVTIVIVIALGALIAYFATHAHRRLAWLPTGMLLGGALGNVVDRLRDGAVTDFVKLPYWPAFNVADMAITVGVLVLLWVVERSGGAARRA